MVATIYQDSSGVRKQVSISNYAVSKIMDMTESGASTKGLIAYEMLMLTTPEYTDPYSRVESRLFSELEQYYNSEVREFFTQNQMASGNKKSVMQELELSCRYDDAHGRMRNCTFYFPESFLETNIEGRGLGDEIASALVESLACPYDDRLERSDIMINLIELAEGSTDNTHSYVSELVSASAMSTSSLESEIGEVIASTLSTSSSKSVDEAVDMTRKDLKEMAENDDLPADRESRIELIECALNDKFHDDDGSTVLVEDTITQFVASTLGYKSRTAREYAGEIMDRDNLLMPVYNTPRDAIQDADTLAEYDGKLALGQLQIYADESLWFSPAAQELRDKI